MLNISIIHPPWIHVYIRACTHINTYSIIRMCKYEKTRHCVVTCTKEKSSTIPATGYSLVERTTLTTCVSITVSACNLFGRRLTTTNRVSIGIKSTVIFVILFAFDLTFIRIYSFILANSNKIQKKPTFVKSRLADVDKTLNEDKKEEGKSKVDNQKEKCE
ncbi:hypothetical protein V1478_013784 [Vespula squamosa]|uniref:Uncharacterized protein n=1 Tax=Vespula squamosa TaxID=30214 RepID=A0ABD2A655_VESSQ